MKWYFSYILLTIYFLTAFPAAYSQNIYAEDFLEFWNDVKTKYVYFDKKVTDWEQVKTFYLPFAQSAISKKDLIPIFENAVEELYDNHFSLNINLQSSARLVPTGLDLWAEWIDDKAIITEVRKGFSADKAGIHPGMEIKMFNGIFITEAVTHRMRCCAESMNDEVKNFVLRQLLAGTYLVPRVIVVSDSGITKTFYPDESGNMADHFQYDSLLQYKMVDDNIGYIKLNNSLGEYDVISFFDHALLNLKNTKALIIDLRETPGGGNSVVARGLMSRFIAKEMPYQKHVLPNEEAEFGIKRSWMEMVSPRGPWTYTKPLVILVNHWTGSMGEGIAIGFDALDRAITIGTPMAGLNGAISGFQTTNLNIPYSFPTEQLYHINGTPRENFIPLLKVDLTLSKFGSMEDAILQEGINYLKASKKKRKKMLSSITSN